MWLSLLIVFRIPAYTHTNTNLRVRLNSLVLKIWRFPGHATCEYCIVQLLSARLGKEHLSYCVKSDCTNLYCWLSIHVYMCVRLSLPGSFPELSSLWSWIIYVCVQFIKLPTDRLGDALMMLINMRRADPDVSKPTTQFSLGEFRP